MFTSIPTITLGIVLFPLFGALVAGLFGKYIGRRGATIVTISCMFIATLLSIILFKQLQFDNAPAFNGNIYTWGISGSFQFNIGFLIDRFTVLMLVVVNFVSLMVHLYSIGYMDDDAGYQRFFSYMSLFTFAMLMLVTANNFLQLYFGWEGVGLVSYLLIGFWFKKDSANFGSLKAFLVNRVGDFGFILGIAGLLATCGTLDYAQIFAQAPVLATKTIQILPGVHWPTINLICVLLFIGAMGKSAQVPLHVWLPESMEGPTPISALIHAATMVTAGVFMVTRMSPLFDYSPLTLTLILIIGATGALFTGILATVQVDIKRVVAYSTLSQLGYMVAALGASAYAAGIFQLVTHAFFKALLFLAAGSVIISMHHEQDMRKMGGLRKYLPLTYVMFLIGALSLSAIPPFSGFFSKDAIIDAVHLSNVPGARYGYFCVLFGTFITALYIFRAFFFTFHGKERFDTSHKVHENGWVMWLPLVLLAIPSIFLGMIMIKPILFSTPGLLGNGVVVNSQNNVLATLATEYHGIWSTVIDSIFTPALWFALSGIFVAWVCYVAVPSLPDKIAKRFSIIYFILLRKYGFDDFNQLVIVKGYRRIANFLFNVGDVKIIDDYLVNGTGRAIGWLSNVARKFQTGYLYQYAFVMVIGLLIFMWWLLR